MVYNFLLTQLTVATLRHLTKRFSDSAEFSQPNALRAREISQTHLADNEATHANVTGQKFGRSRRHATVVVEAFFVETGDPETKIMRPSSVWLAVSHLLLILNSSSCDQDEVCETESCGENELSEVSCVISNGTRNILRIIP